MGQLSSVNKIVKTSSPATIIPGSVTIFQDEVLRQAKAIQEIAVLSYEDFLICLEQLNELCRTVTDINGKQLFFAVKKGTDSTVLWKGTVKVACIKVNPETKIIESHRLFNLNQFLKIFKTLECQLSAALQSSKKERFETISSSKQSSSDNNHINSMSNESSPQHSKSNLFECNTSSFDESGNTSDDSNSSKDFDEKKSGKNILNNNEPKNIKLKEAQVKNLTASILLDEVDNLANSIGDKLGECSICFERKRDVMLPCTHSYCMPCIEQWCAWHKTCPFCRETLNSTNDTWVISDIPGFQEISDDICSALIKLTSSE